MRTWIAMAGVLLFSSVAAHGQSANTTAVPVTATPASPTTAAPTAARAESLTGVWKGAFDFNGESIPLTLNLTAGAGAVTGTVEGLPTTPAEIHDGKLDGNTLTFWLNTDYQGATYRLVYTGKVLPGQIVFAFGTDDGSWGADVTAAKVQ